MIKKTAQEMHELHLKLHIFNIPHNCKEFERHERNLQLAELFSNPISLFIYHRGMNN